VPEGGYVIQREYFKDISEHGIFHGNIDFQDSKLLKIKDKKRLFAIEWE